MVIVTYIRCRPRGATKREFEIVNHRFWRDSYGERSTGSGQSSERREIHRAADAGGQGEGFPELPQARLVRAGRGHPGEDREEYEIHRETLLEQLDPAGPLEAILAARVVDLSWRLRRAAQDQNEAFGALYDRYTAGAGEPPEPQERKAVLGRMILEDFEHEAVLERLQRYERRIESSFYRTLNELRRVHDQGRKADQEVADTLGRWRQEDGEARKARALACNAPVAYDCGLRISDCGLKDDGPERPMARSALS
jgi:hypothetical protein